jgi:hypothetical protein
MRDYRFTAVPGASAAVALTALLWLGLAGTVQATGIGDFVVGSSKAAGLENCVEPTEYMRRNHMEVIRHQRDTTVYGGIRSTKHSLSGCVECHVGYDDKHQPVAIDDDDQFCSACHDYAAVTLNCFDCHATVPQGEAWNKVHPTMGHSLVPGVETQAAAATASAGSAAAPESKTR